VFQQQKYQWKTPEVAALAWIIGSPPMLTNSSGNPNFHLIAEDWCTQQHQLHTPWLAELDQNPKPLRDFLDREKPLLLGKIFEALVAFWMIESPHFDLVERNIQFFTGRKTSSEMDFLLRSVDTGHLIHLEVACKYYLGQRSSGQWSNWIGPNGKDNLLLKMEKTKRQFSLEVLEKMEEKNLIFKGQQVQNHFLLKGYFFQPFQSLGGFVKPFAANAHYHGGWYLRSSELGHFASDFKQWIILPKKNWMGPFCGHCENFELLNGNEMISACVYMIEKTGKAQLIIQAQQEGDLLVEVSRGFVVKNDWPFDESK
jgi:uncharacterized protein